ncbi:MAG TPA: ParB/RepB/Spo0J family partition protein [bacterium]|jgi:ParB family chromosome partitioning protein
MKMKKGLGKGLAALISEADVPDENGTVVTDVAVKLVDPNPFQPRQVFDDEAIEDLKRSILAKGVLQPVLVRKYGERFQLIVGERRWRASCAAGLEHIPALVRESASDEDMLELAVLENLQREDLNPIEVAHAILKLQTTCSLTQEAVADKLGVSRAHVANTVRLLKLPETMQAAVCDGKITAGHARALLGILDPREQIELFQRYISDSRPTVRQAEDLKRMATGKAKRSNGEVSALDRRQELEIKKMEDRMRRTLSTRVKIKPKGRGGTIEIQFYTSDDLNRLLEFFDH